MLLRIPDNIRSVHGPDGGTVLDIGHGRMFNLNPVGSRILELLKTGHAESKIAMEISKEFGVGPETIELDVREFLASLVSYKLLETDNAEVLSPESAQ